MVTTALPERGALRRYIVLAFVETESKLRGRSLSRIFEREAPKVKSWDSFKRLIRWNKFETDPVCAPLATSKTHRARSGTCAIAARGDLPGPHGSAFGGIDAKVLKVSEMRKVLPVEHKSRVPARAPLVRTMSRLGML